MVFKRGEQIVETTQEARQASLSTHAKFLG